MSCLMTLCKFKRMQGSQPTKEKIKNGMAGVAVVSHLQAHTTPEMDPILTRIDCSQACFRSSFL